MATSTIDRGLRWTSLMAIVMTVVALASIVVGIYLSDDGVRVFLFGIAFASLVFVFLPVYFKRDYMIFEPHSFVLGSVVLGMFFKTFYLMVGIGRSDVVDKRLMLGLTAEVLQFGAFVLFLGLGVYAIGYLLGGLGTSKIVGVYRNYRFPYSRAVGFSFLVIVISIVLFSLHVQAVGFSFNQLSDLSQKRFVGEGQLPGERFGQIAYIYYKLALLSKAPMYLLFYMVYRYRQSWFSAAGLLFFVALTLNIVAPFFVSNKAGIILPLVDLLVISFLISRRFNWRAMIVVAGSGVAIMAIIAAFRGGEAFAQFDTFDKIFGNRYFVEITKTAHIVNAVPDVVDYFYGKSFIAWLNMVLPQSLEFDSIYFADMGFYLGSQVFFTVHSGVTPGIIAESYLNFGLAGVVLCMFVVGYSLSRIHRNLSGSMDNAVVLIIYALFVVRAPAMLFNGSLSTAILKCGLDIFTVFLFLMLVKSQRGSFK